MTRNRSSLWMMRGGLLALATMCSMAVAPAWAGGLDSLEAFVKKVRTGRAQFTQTVTPPAKEGEGAPRARVTSGSFEFQRPGRFKFDYKKPFAQLIVADGENLWLYDADLNQVTQRKQAQALGSTPAALIASAADLQSLRTDFDLKELPARDGLEWVQATPKSRDGQLQHVQVGFAGERLSALEILDSFGQKSVLRFDNVEINPQLPAGTFTFTPPKGADLIRQ